MPTDFYGSGLLDHIEKAAAFVKIEKSNTREL
jgi:hypothetical protein